jgi:hypothetical protein
MSKWYMVWQSLPKDGEQIILRIGPDFEIATFSHEKKVFILRDGREKSAFFPMLQWMRVSGAKSEC